MRSEKQIARSIQDMARQELGVEVAYTTCLALVRKDTRLPGETKELQAARIFTEWSRNRDHLKQEKR